MFNSSLNSIHILPAACLNWNWFYCKYFFCSWLCSTCPQILSETIGSQENGGWGKNSLLENLQKDSQIVQCFSHLESIDDDAAWEMITGQNHHNKKVCQCSCWCCEQGLLLYAWIMMLTLFMATLKECCSCRQEISQSRSLGDNPSTAFACYYHQVKV